MIVNFKPYQCLFSSIVVVIISLCASWGLEIWVGSTVAVLLLLQLSVVMIALQCRARIVYVSAVLEALAFYFLFTSPRFSLQMFQPEDIVNVTVFLIVAFTTSQLAERYRQQQSELQQAKLRNRILLSISHDLRTPLSGIIGNLTTLREYMPQLKEAERNELLDSATQESHRLHQYIENLLNATKIQYGALALRKEDESLIDILHSAITRFDKGEEIVELNFEENLPPVSASASLLEQALFNVLDNAVRFSAKNKTVKVTVCQEFSHIITDIKNVGDPLSVEDAQHMFDLFYTGSSDSGTGLGLAVAKGIISLHQGEINHIPVSDGCQIRIRLPISKGSNNDI